MRTHVSDLVAPSDVRIVRLEDVVEVLPGLGSLLIQPLPRPTWVIIRGLFGCDLVVLEDRLLIELASVEVSRAGSELLGQVIDVILK